MKKLLTFLILSILFTSSAYAKIDKSYVKQIYEGCISDAKQNNDYNSNSKKFCKCYANQFNVKFNNAGLMEFMNKSDQAKAQIIQNEISPPCYPTSNSSQKSNSNLIILKDCYPKGHYKNFKEKKKEGKIEEWFYEIDINNRIVTETKIYFDAEVQRLKKVSPGARWSKFKLTKYNIEKSSKRLVETDYNFDLELVKTKLRIDFKLGRVESEMVIVFNDKLMVGDGSAPYFQCTVGR